MAGITNGYANGQHIPTSILQKQIQYVEWIAQCEYTSPAVHGLNADFVQHTQGKCKTQMSDNDNQPQPASAPPPIAPKKFLTNQGDNTLSKRLEKILPQTHDFDCLVGYFFISGFFRLYPALEPEKISASSLA